MNDTFSPILASVALASLSKQLWESADKVALDPKAREKVFRAAQKLYPGFTQDRKDVIVDNFEYALRGTAVFAGGASLVCSVGFLNSNLLN